MPSHSGPTNGGRVLLAIGTMWLISASSSSVATALPPPHEPQATSKSADKTVVFALGLP